LTDLGVKILHARPLFGLPVLAENVRGMFKKLLLLLRDLVRMNLVPLGKLNEHLLAFQRLLEGPVPIRYIFLKICAMHNIIIN